MKIVVPVKFVPDLVEELTIDSGGAALDTSWLRLIINEFDDHAVEQAILLKERDGGQVIVAMIESEGADDFLFASAAKGADQLIKLTGDFTNSNNHALALAYADLLKELQPDLILTGVQAHNDLDGSVGPLLAEYLGMPYVGYVAGLTATNDKVTARKEYSGGLIAEIEVKLPAVLGIQAAEQPPRYIAYSKIRQVMGTAKIEERAVASLDLSGGTIVNRMFQPEVAERATMIEGSADEVADKLVGIFKELGTL
ncbi:MAG: electron transfer flavoprotein subunit beta/FixA family protein [Anaerolineales bacterium]|nr:electron transfer flavoprotein subunit beta/FixA family protein [Anaerolineales bacterium]